MVRSAARCYNMNVFRMRQPGHVAPQLFGIVYQVQTILGAEHTMDERMSVRVGHAIERIRS